MKEYTPIDCNFYDELVLLSMHKTEILFLPNFYHVPEGDFIIDLVTKSTKEEFLVMNSGIEIRLDRITSLDGHILFLGMDEDSMDFEEE